MSNRTDRRRLFVVAAFVLVSVTRSSTVGAWRANNDCSKLTIECPAELPESGKTYVVKLRVDGANQKLTFKWSVSSGEIVGGQGTTAVKIHITDLSKGITATVEVGGLPYGCENIASCSFTVS